VKETKILKLMHGIKPLQIEVFDDFIGHHIAAGTFWEVTFLMKTLKKLQHDMVLVDVGANIGNHTMFWAKYLRRVIAIEGSKQIADVLRRNIERNDYPNVEVINAIVDDAKDKPVSEKTFDTNLGRTMFNASMEGTLRTQTLDDLVNEPIDVMKIDVEGAEIRALRGARRLLTDHHPLLFVEVHTPEVTRKMVTDELKPYDYRVGDDLILR